MEAIDLKVNGSSYKGSRIKRGLFLSSVGKALNADIRQANFTVFEKRLMNF